jgi:hypothetical protein
MALEITATVESKLTVKGTTAELSSIYSRLEFALPKDGEKMGAALYNYESKALYETDANNFLKTNELSDNYNVAIDVAAGEEQSLETGHQKVKEQLEADGYTVAIVGLPTT